MPGNVWTARKRWFASMLQRRNTVQFCILVLCGWAFWAQVLFLFWSLIMPTVVVSGCITGLVVFAARRVASSMGPKSAETIAAFREQSRPQGREFVLSRPVVSGSINGAVLITGATGFLGSGILFVLLTRAAQLNITRIVLLIRQKRGMSMKERIEKLRSDPIFEEVRCEFDALVSGIEGDIAQEDFGRSQAAGSWPYDESLTCVVHCAADVRFDLPLQEAAVSQVSATLQIARLAVRWRAQRMVFISTAFVHPAPSSGAALPESVVDLCNIDPAEVYRDAIDDGRWSYRVMRSFGFPNTYTFMKAIAELLVLRAGAADNLDVRIVRPPIVGPAWAAPFAGWSGNSPSTAVAAAVLCMTFVSRVFRVSRFPAPVMPVDLVAEAVVDALAAPSTRNACILHAAVDVSEAHKMWSFQDVVESVFTVASLHGTVSLTYASVIFVFLRWAENRKVFRFLHSTLNVLPFQVASLVCSTCSRMSGCLPGLDQARWERRHTFTRKLVNLASAPDLFEPFSAPEVPWTFSSSRKLPRDWDSAEYLLMIPSAALTFVKSRLRNAPDRQSLSALREVPVLRQQACWFDFFDSITRPHVPLHRGLASFVAKRVLVHMGFSITVDGASLASSLDDSSQSPVLCPTSRSLVDLAVLAALRLHLGFVVPGLHSSLSVDGTEAPSQWILQLAAAALGVSFLDTHQSNPIQTLASIQHKTSKTPSLVSFLEGTRSQGRRHLRGSGKVLRNVTILPATLLPVAISYELLPEDNAFEEELRSDLSGTSKVSSLWMLRSLRRKIPTHGEAFIKFGDRLTRTGEWDDASLLQKLQEQHIALTSITELHSRALANILELPPVDVLNALNAEGYIVRQTGLGDVPLSSPQMWMLCVPVLVQLRHHLPARWRSWIVETVSDEPKLQSEEEIQKAAHRKAGERNPDSTSGKFNPEVPLKLDAITKLLVLRLNEAEERADQVAQDLKKQGASNLDVQHVAQQLMCPYAGKEGLPALLAHGAAHVATTCLVQDCRAGESSCARRCDEEVTLHQYASAPVEALWPVREKGAKDQTDDAEALERWGYRDSRFRLRWVGQNPVVEFSSLRYGALKGSYLWQFFQDELGIQLRPQIALKELPFPKLPPPPPGLVERLRAVIPEDRIRTDSEARVRCGTGHGLADIWRLRTRTIRRMPDVVVCPKIEEEISALLKLAGDTEGFAIVVVGGRTNVTSATACASKEVDERPFVAVDMRGLARIHWVNRTDGTALVEAGITGSALKDALAKEKVTMGMEPDSMEFSTLGGWIATRASGMKRARYGNIEDLVIEVHVITPVGALWQHHGKSIPSHDLQSEKTAFGRTSGGVALPGLLLGSEGCLGIVTAAVVRVRPLPQVTEYQSVLFATWEKGSEWMHDVARLPVPLRPTSCRLMDNRQLRLAQALRGEASQSDKSSWRSSIKAFALQVRGIAMENACAATLLFEGVPEEVAMQQKAVSKLVASAGGLWGGASRGEAGYALTFAIAYLRDFGIDNNILSESFETFVPWSTMGRVWPAVQAAVVREHAAMRLPGRPFLSCRMTQLYDEGAVLYMYLATALTGYDSVAALEAFEHLEKTARHAVLAAGGCLSHHHGIGKVRAKFLPKTQSKVFREVLQNLKTAMDPKNILAARNGAWADLDNEEAMELEASSIPDQVTTEELADSIEQEPDNVAAANGSQQEETSLEERFDAAALQVKEKYLSEGDSLSNEKWLSAYAFFKQAKFGDVKGPQPWRYELRQRAKYDAWNRLRGTNQKDAMISFLEIHEALVGNSG